MKFCIIDIHNMVHRAYHAIGNSTVAYDPFGDINRYISDRSGLIISSVFVGIRNAFIKFDCDHCIATFDLRSWRRDFYPEYKANRRNKVKTPSDEADAKMLMDVIDEIKIFLRDYTNVTVLEATGAEADDFVARWIQIHHEDVFHNVIVSSDSDFKQLVSDNTILYNPMSRILYTVDGIYHQDKRKSTKDETRITLFDDRWFVKKDKHGIDMTFDPVWELFVKCIRGDTSDNISTAWYRVTTSKMKSAFNGTTEEYNNFINSTWGKDGDKHSVRELYERNKTLIDLTAQPDDIQLSLDETILLALDMPIVKFIGAHFARFCSKHKLTKLLSQSDVYNTMLSSVYSN